MSKRIHGEDSVTCANNAGYSLFILYTGHGHGREDESKGADDKNGKPAGGDDDDDSNDKNDYNEEVFGDWCPTENDVISRADIDKHLESLFKCSRSQRGQVGECKTGCM